MYEELEAAASDYIYAQNFWGYSDGDEVWGRCEQARERLCAVLHDLAEQKGRTRQAAGVGL